VRGFSASCLSDLLCPLAADLTYGTDMTETNSFTAKTWILILSLVLIALTLRPSMASIGPLLPFMQPELHLSFTQASLLTMLPVLAMGLGIFFAHQLALWFGSYQVVFWASIAIAAATAQRYWAVGALDLTLSAIVAGLGIAMVQAVVPGVIKQKFGTKAPLVMGWYISAIIAGAALTASLAAFWADWAQSWRVALSGWVVLSVLALVLWFSQKNAIQNLPVAQSQQKPLSFSKHGRSWTLALFFGLVTCAFTCVLAWLPAYYVEQGWSEQKSGLLLGLLLCMEVVSGFVSPWLASRKLDRRPVMLVLLVLMATGFAGLVVAPQLGLIWASLLGLGIGGLFPLSLIVSMDHQHQPSAAASLTAFVQGIGYTLAAFSPLIAGFIRDFSQSFSISWLLLAAIAVLLMVMATRFNPVFYESRFE
jgi:CP family cyanate transporter-like MFS transporter